MIKNKSLNATASNADEPFCFNHHFLETDMLEEFADRIQNAKDKQFKIFERFHIGDTVYPFWLNNFVVYGTVIDIDLVARKIICDFNGVRRQFCPEDLMLVNPVLAGPRGGNKNRTADWKNSFEKKLALKGVEEKPEADNGINCVCKECGGEVAVSYNERTAKTDFVCTQCGKRISEDKVSKKCKEKMRKGSLSGEIEKSKRKLVSDAKRNGIPEDFGQREVMKLRDKYGYDELIEDFDEWCQNFDLNSLGRTANSNSVSHKVAFASSENSLDELKMADEIAGKIVAGIDQKDYEFYVVLDDGSIESGWEYKEDAKDRQDELKEDGIKSKIYTRRFLENSDRNPDEDDNWHKGMIASGERMDYATAVKIARELATTAKELLAQSEEEIPVIPFKTKKAVEKFIYDSVDGLVKGLHDDDAWQDIQAIWKRLRELGMDLEVTVENGGYSPDGKSKTYKFSFPVKNSEGKTLEMNGQVVAFAAGTVGEPWKKYDMIFQIF